MKSFILYTDIYECIKDLSLEEKGKLLDSIYLYSIEKKEIPLHPETKMAFSFIKTTLLRNEKKYNNICERNRSNGKKGGRPRLEEKPQKPTGLFGNPKNHDSDNDSNSDSVSVSNTEEELLLPKKSNKLNLSKSQVIAIQREFTGITTTEVREQMEKCSNYMTISSTTYTNPGLFFKGWLKKFMGEKNKKELIEKQQRNVLDSLPEISEEQRIKNIERMEQIKSSLKLKEVF
jgi:hypothetical protein